MSVSGGSGRLRLRLTDTDFGIATTGSRRFAYEIGGVSDGTVTGTVTYDDGNLEFGAGVDLVVGSVAETGSTQVNNADPFSMTIDLVVEHFGPGDITSFNLIASVPEPASLSLLGLGAIALIRRRRKK